MIKRPISGARDAEESLLVGGEKDGEGNYGSEQSNRRLDVGHMQHYHAWKNDTFPNKADWFGIRVSPIAWKNFSRGLCLPSPNSSQSPRADKPDVTNLWHRLILELSAWVLTVWPSLISNTTFESSQLGSLESERDSPRCVLIFFRLDLFWMYIFPIQVCF